MFLGVGGAATECLGAGTRMRLSQLESESLVRIRGFYSDGRVKSYASNINNETSNTKLEDGGNKVSKFHGSYYVER